MPLTRHKIFFIGDPITCPLPAIKCSLTHSPLTCPLPAIKSSLFDSPLTTTLLPTIKFPFTGHPLNACYPHMKISHTGCPSGCPFPTHQKNKNSLTCPPLTCPLSIRKFPSPTIPWHARYPRPPSKVSRTGCPFHMPITRHEKCPPGPSLNTPIYLPMKKLQHGDRSLSF